MRQTLRLFATESAVYYSEEDITHFPITGGVVVDRRLQRIEKSTYFKTPIKKSWLRRILNRFKK